MGGQHLDPTDTCLRDGKPSYALLPPTARIFDWATTRARTRLCAPTHYWKSTVFLIQETRGRERKQRATSSSGSAQADNGTRVLLTSHPYGNSTNRTSSASN